MKFRVPFSFASLDKLNKRSSIFRKLTKYKKESPLSIRLKQADLKITREEYLAICYGGAIKSFLILFLVSSTVLFFLKINYFLLSALAFSFIFSFFVFFSRFVYPKVYINRKEREIERNLIPALQDITVQLTSGIPLFSILVNISLSDYSTLSEEFGKIVRMINAGLPETDVLDEIGESNPSLLFRRALWQISNGMKAGSDISIIIKDTITSLSEEQLIQIQNYGNKLNPSIMFYMLVSVILPALAITFLTVVSSLINLSSKITISLFVVMFVFVVLIQIMFLGVIRSIRPTLL